MYIKLYSENVYMKRFRFIVRRLPSRGPKIIWALSKKVKISQFTYYRNDSPISVVWNKLGIKKNEYLIIIILTMWKSSWLSREFHELYYNESLHEKGRDLILLSCLEFQIFSSIFSGMILKFTKFTFHSSWIWMAM